jgi:anti-sigma B factor antagonist
MKSGRTPSTSSKIVRATARKPCLHCAIEIQSPPKVAATLLGLVRLAFHRRRLYHGLGQQRRPQIQPLPRTACYSNRNMALKWVIRRPKKDVILGELDGRLLQGNELQTLKSELASLAGEPRIMLILDLSRVEYADSAGLGVMLYLDGLAQQAGSTLRLAGAGRRLLEVLKMTHTDKVLTLDPDVASSLKHSGS